MSSEYYTLEKTAEVLGLPPAEVNRLRERAQLRAFRDGSSWKFRKVDIDDYLAETIKNRSKQDTSDSDFDLLGSDEEDETPTLLADSASFDAIMEDGLTLDNEMIDAEVSLAKGENDDLTLAGEVEVDLSIADDEVIFDEAGSSPKLNLAKDSGLSLLDAVELEAVEKSGSDAFLEIDDDDILAVVETESAEQTSTIAIPVVEEEFQLTPGIDMHADDSESSSQVIPLEDSMFGTTDGIDLGKPFDAPSPDAAPQPGPFGGVGEYPSTPIYPGQPSTAEPTYGTLAIVGMVACVFLLVVCGWFGLDLMINIWSWNEPYVIRSTFMDLVAGLLGLV